jgi:hypothetical protein
VNDVSFSTAEPESVLLIDVSDISHAVPERVSIGNFCKSVSIRPLEVLASGDGATNDDFSDLPGRQEASFGDGAEGLAGGFDDTDIDVIEGCTDTGAVSDGRESGGFAEDFTGSYGGDGEAFGSAVGGEEVSVGRECCGHSSEYMEGDWGAGGEDAAESVEGNVLGFAVSADAIPHGGGAVGLGSVPGAECFEDDFRIDSGRPSGVHVGDDGGDLHSEVEEGEQWEAGDVDFAGLDLVAIADEVDLSIEHLMFEEDAFRWSSAAACEDDGGWVGGFGRGEWWRVFAAVFEELSVGDAAESEG